jgi:hypothetical protein
MGMLPACRQTSGRVEDASLVGVQVPWFAGVGREAIPKPARPAAAASCAKLSTGSVKARGHREQEILYKAFCWPDAGGHGERLVRRADCKESVASPARLRSDPFQSLGDPGICLLQAGVFDRRIEGRIEAPHPRPLGMQLPTPKTHCEGAGSALIICPRIDTKGSHT